MARSGRGSMPPGAVCRLPSPPGPSRGAAPRPDSDLASPDGEPEIYRGHPLRTRHKQMSRNSYLLGKDRGVWMAREASRGLRMAVSSVSPATAPHLPARTGGGKPRIQLLGDDATGPQLNLERRACQTNPAKIPLPSGCPPGSVSRPVYCAPCPLACQKHRNPPRPSGPSRRR